MVTSLRWRMHSPRTNFTFTFEMGSKYVATENEFIVSGTLMKLCMLSQYWDKPFSLLSVYSLL